MHDPIAAAFAAQDALLALLRARPEYADTGVALGPSLNEPPEAVWVSCMLDDDNEPIVSNLAVFEDKFDLAVAVAVTQYAGEDWTPVRARLGELTTPVEATLAGDRTMGGACSLAHVGQVSVRESVTEDNQVRLFCAQIIRCRLRRS